MSRELILDLCDGAEAWHEIALAELLRIDGLLSQSEAAPGLIAPWVHFVRGLRAHMNEEEEVLFPALRAIARGEVPEGDQHLVLLEEMAQEIGEIQTIAEALRSATRDAGEVEAPILDLLDQLEAHARREEEELLPAAHELLRRRAATPPPAPTPPPPAPPRPEGSMLRRTARRLRELLGPRGGE